MVAGISTGDELWRRRWFGLRSDGEPEGEGKKEKVQEDRVLTLEAWARSVVKGKAGGDGNRAQRPADGEEEEIGRAHV